MALDIYASRLLLGIPHYRDGGERRYVRPYKQYAIHYEYMIARASISPTVRAKVSKLPPLQQNAIFGRAILLSQSLFAGVKVPF